MVIVMGLSRLPGLLGRLLWHRVSKVVEDCNRLPVLLVGHPMIGCKAVSRVTRPQGVEGSDIAGSSETLGSLRIPHGIKTWRDVWVEVGNRRCQSSGGPERIF